MLDDDGLINLNEFKKIIWHFKTIVNQQLDFREQIENFLKIKVDAHQLFEVKYIFKDFYVSILDYLYGRDRKTNHLYVKDLVKVVTCGFQNARFFEIA